LAELDLDHHDHVPRLSADSDLPRVGTGSRADSFAAKSSTSRVVSAAPRTSVCSCRSMT
jgi:hypothetical protein